MNAFKENLGDEDIGNNPGPVTVIITHKIKRTHKNDFKHWLKGINQEASQYEGYLGVQVIEPHSNSDQEYVIIVRFNNYQNLKTWNESDIRKRYLDKLEPLTEDKSTWEQQTGLEYWFTLPKAPSHVPPNKHKMASVTWIAITPLIMAVPPVLEPLLMKMGLPRLASIPIVCAVLVILMTYAVMPFTIKMLKRWL
jgi:antibiotic biosynthesis monooxygenase (ABM) superfamily enzyme